MKKKSLYDIAMEKILKLLFYIVLFIFVTIGATVLINSELRWQLINMIKTIF